MGPRVRTVLVWVTCVLLVAGLLFAGPAHFGLHKDGDGPTCDACAIAGTTPVLAITITGPPQTLRFTPVCEPERVLESPPHLLPPPRGPPASC